MNWTNILFGALVLMTLIAASLWAADIADGTHDETSHCKEDPNADGFIDISDIVAIGGQFGKPVPPAPAYLDINPALSGDGFVDISDIVAAGAHFGQGCIGTSGSDAFYPHGMGTLEISQCIFDWVGFTGGRANGWIVLPSWGMRSLCEGDLAPYSTTCHLVLYKWSTTMGEPGNWIPVGVTEQTVTSGLRCNADGMATWLELGKCYMGHLYHTVTQDGQTVHGGSGAGYEHLGDFVRCLN